MTQEEDSYELENRPDAIDSVPRDSTHGTVVDEIGVFQCGNEKDYWKVVQRIETEGMETHIRFGYYAGKDGDWSWSPRPMMLSSKVVDDLYTRAVTEEVLVE